MANKKSGPKAGDATGREKAKLEADQAEASLKRQEELTMINQQTAVENSTAVFDPRTGEKVADDGDPVEDLDNVASDDAVEDNGVEVARPTTVTIRVNDTLTNVTIGAGTNFNFEEGKKYDVPVHVARHLEEKGYVWH